MIDPDACRAMPPPKGSGLLVSHRRCLSDAVWVKAGGRVLDCGLPMVPRAYSRYRTVSFAFVHPSQTRLGASLSRHLYVGRQTYPPIQGRIRPITGGVDWEGGDTDGGRGGHTGRGVRGDVPSKFLTPETFPTSPWDHQPSYLCFRSRSPPAWTGAKQHGEPAEIELEE